MLPTLHRINKMDFKDAPPWLDRLIVPINNFFQGVYNLLSGRLRLVEHVRAEIVDLNLRAPVTGFTFTTNLANPDGVILLGISGPSYTGIVVLRTRQDGKDIVIEDLSGLTAGELYSIRILVL